MMGMLLPLGIEKGKEFKPDAATVTQLNSAAAEAHAWLLGPHVPISTLHVCGTIRQRDDAARKPQGWLE
jgi:hypothetical protein